MHAERIGKWTAVALILIVGGIHLVEAPDQFNDATYKGLLFLANATGALIAAAAIGGGLRWGRPLGVLVAGGATVAYVVSRTVGLPGLPVDPAWFEPAGVLSLVGEGLFIVLALKLPRWQSTTVSERARAA
ncbi:MAG: hypothetical protein ACR2PL_04250 [Dehalococcoidia bacterium]